MKQIFFQFGDIFNFLTHNREKNGVSDLDFAPLKKSRNMLDSLVVMIKKNC